MKITGTHIYFWRGTFSNWKHAPFEISGVGKFANTEQAYMWCKAHHFKDEESQKLILAQTDPKEVKALGRAVKGFDSNEWSKHCLQYMVWVNRFKYGQNPEMLKELLKTGNKTLVEASPYDTVWGVGLAEDDPLILDELNWRGQNLLGQALMTVRKELK